MSSLNAEHKKLLFSNRISFLLAGFGIAAWAPMIPYVKERFLLDEHTLGLLLLCVGIGSLVSMPTSGYFSSRFGCKLPIYISNFVLAACLVAIPVIHNIYLMAIVLFIMGMSAVTLDVVSNINAALVEKITQSNVMSGLHGLYSVGGFIGSLTLTFILSANFGIVAAGIYAAVAMIICCIFGAKHLLSTIKEEKDEEQSTSNEDKVQDEGKKGLTLSYYTHPTVLIIGFMCFIMFMTEGSMLDWSGVFLYQERGISLEHAGYGYAAFAIMMTVFRLTGDKIVATFGRRRIILLGTLLICLGFVTAVVFEHYIAAFIGFGLIGVGASNVVPQLVSFVAKVDEVPLHISITVVNAIGFTGILCGPALIGFLAHAISLPYTYICQGILVLFVTVMAFFILKTSPDEEKAVTNSHE